MSGYPSLNEIEIAWRKSGTGICIIVEGETELEDAWFYKQWFDYRAREISFFPQDGYEKVELAVAQLRERLGPKQVYGIIDRDFASDEIIAYRSIPSKGVLRTPKYTLENYLLDANCWFEYIRPHTRRVPKPGWNTLAEVKATIEDLFRQCIPISAYNWTLRQAREQNYDDFGALPEPDKLYKEHPRALENLGDVPDHLRQIEKKLGLTDLDLPQLYDQRLLLLRQAPLKELVTVVSGKYVLELLRQNFPLASYGKRQWVGVLDAYIDKCPDPPSDLVSLIELILADAHS